MELTTQDVYDALIPVEDPELGYSVVELGLLRGIELDPKSAAVRVLLTLTSPMCPMGPEIVADVRSHVEQLDGVGEVKVELVWSPPWDPATDASEEIRAEFDIWV